MVANLEFIGGKAAMFYALDSGVPWHNEGVSVETAVSVEEALHLAQLDHTVSLEKIRLVDGPQIPNKRAVVRDFDRKALGVVSPDYKPIQNREAFEFLDSLYSDGKLLFDTAGALNGGATVWALARMTEDMRIGTDVYGKYLLVTTSHDGLHSLAVYATSVRVVCENTLLAATGAAASILIRHSGDIVSKMEQARKVWAVTDERHRRMETWLNRLTEVKIDDAFLTGVQEKVFGALDDATPTQRRAAINAFQEIYAAEKDLVGENAYAVVNAITGFADHKTRVTKNGTRMNSVISGSSAGLKRKGFAAVQKMTGAKI